MGWCILVKADETALGKATYFAGMDFVSERRQDYRFKPSCTS